MTSTSAPPAKTVPAPGRTGWRQVVRALRQPRVLIMLLLGFSSGLPFFLTANTLAFWLREGGVQLSTIGFLSWVGLAYTLKFLWAPIIDRIDAPLVGRRLGRRRGWLVVSQALVAAGLFGIAATGPSGSLAALAAAALLAAFASATQDVVVDAWRIEAAETADELGLLAAAYALGYRTAIIATDALILVLAAQIGWPASYVTAGLAMGIGTAATLAAAEPLRQLVQQSALRPLWTPRGLIDAIVGPFVAFFQTHGRLALLMLAVVSLYRLPEFMIGPMVNPFYVDLGLTKTIVGSIRTSIGIWGTMAGIALGGVAAVKLGLGRTLILGAITGSAANLVFTVMAVAGPDLTLFAVAMFFDNLGQSLAGVALVGYMSTLTSAGYTATQYALLSSFYAVLGKILKGFSGLMLEALTAAGLPLMDAYAWFFVGTALIGVPALILSIFLARAIRPARAAE